MITSTNLPLPLIARGKVRDVYSSNLSDESILFIATDRISAFDVILSSGIPSKGKLLTDLSKFWFDLLTPSIIPSHIISTEFQDFPEELKEKLKDHKEQVVGRSMLVKKAKVLPIEAIVRGYITGSGWKEYQRKGTVHGIEIREGMKESQEFEGGPIFTPSTKAEQGQHDENIHPDQGESSKRRRGESLAMSGEAFRERKGQGDLGRSERLENRGSLAWVTVNLFGR